MPASALPRGKFSACALVVILLVSCRSPSGNPPAATTEPLPSKQAQLAAAVHQADRIEVAALDAVSGSRTVLTTRGPGAANDFLASVPIDDFGGDYRCGCDGSHAVRFYSGERLLVELTLHHFRVVRWRNGPWSTDAFLAGAPSAAFSAWFFRNGGTLDGLSSTTGPGPYADAPARPDFASFFPETVRHLLPERSFASTEGWDTRSIASPLSDLMPDKVALATATFRALGSSRWSWLADDHKIGVAQTAAAGIPAADLLTALEANANDDQAMRGAARLYFRLFLNRHLDAAANATWLPRLADAALRTGEARNRSLVLVYVAATGEPAGFAFLREIATGTRTYPWEMRCADMGDMPQEPSLVAAAAVLLALRGDADAPVLATSGRKPAVGMDEAAKEIARTLVDRVTPLKPAHFKYPSHVLGFAAAEAMARQSSANITVGTVRAAFDHQDHWVARRVRLLAEANGLTRYYESADVELHSAPVSQMLASEDPVRAIAECSRHLDTVQGRKRTALLLIRAAAHENQNDANAAIADFEEALQTGGYSPVTIHRRLAWLLWSQGRLIETTRHIEQALREQPDADMLVLRGITKYAVNDFGPSADLDFSAALALEPNHGYARILQHLCAGLSGRPQLSRLGGDTRYESPPPATLTLNIGTPGISQTDAGVAWWPAQIIAFFKGELTGDQLLEAAHPGGAAEPSMLTAEAHFYLAQHARVVGNTDLERKHLAQCVAVPLPQLAEYRLAVIRLDNLK